MTTTAALAGAIRDARAAWRPRTTLAAAAFGLAAFAPLVAGDARTADLASGLYLASAAVALGFVLGIAGMPLLAQGAFVALGAVTAAHIGSTPAGAAAGVLAGGAAGLLTGAAFGRLPRAAFAAATWIVTWLVALALQSVGWLLGGSEGTVVIGGPTPAQHYELALTLTGLAALAYVALVRAPFGLQLAAARDREAAARALGLPVDRLRVLVLAAAGAVAGLTGALAVHLAGVGDPAAYGAFLSFKLFVVVLVGGALAPLGAVAGVIVLAVLSVAADAIGSLEHVATARTHTLFAAVMLLGVVSLSWNGIVRPVRVRRSATGGGGPPLPAPARLEALELRKRYGEVTAADGVSLLVQPGRVTALVGPNGSGKTTVLRLLDGTVTPDEGRIVCDGAVARTLQATAVFPTLTPLEHLLAASAGRRRAGGLLRSLLSTPRARAEDTMFAGWARAVLERFGLPDDTPAGELPVIEQRALMVASAYATGAPILLVDEPTAGASHAEAQRIVALLRALRDEGLALLVVEHNLRVVHGIADEVVEL